MKDLYVQESSYRLGVFEDKLIVRDKDKEIIREIRLAQLENVLVFGNAQLTTQLLKRLARRQVNVYYFSDHGEFLTCLETYRKEDFDKQTCQVERVRDEVFCLNLAKVLIKGKITNQVNLLKAYDRDFLLGKEDYDRFSAAIKGVETASNLAEIMGFEGRLAKSYFYYLNFFLPKDFRFARRSRPAADAVNALLNLGYSILYSFFIGMIRKHGLSQGFGVIHQPKRTHAVLASDLMEMWRTIIVDDTVVKLVRSGSFDLKDFSDEGDKGVRLSLEEQQVFYKALRQRMQEVHPYFVGDDKRYSFFYAADLQVNSLVRTFASGNVEDFLRIKEGDEEVDHVL